MILAGVVDVRNIKRKIRPEEEYRVNSPWNTRESNEESASLLAFDDCPEKLLVHEKNPLFDSLTGKLGDYPELRPMLRAFLFEGRSMSYVAGNQAIEIASMYGFVRNAGGSAAVANRIKGGSI